MPSLLNKMKGAMQGDSSRQEGYYEGEDDYAYDRDQQPDYQHSVDAHGNVTSHNAGDQLPGHHNTGVAGNDFANTNQPHATSGFDQHDQRFSNVGDQGATHTTHLADNDNSHGFVPDKHRDGRDYVPPRGTAVGQTGAGVDNSQYGSQHGSQHGGHQQSAFERSDQGLTGRDQYGQTGRDHHLHDPSSRKAVRDDNLMDPADRAHGSNVMDPDALPDEQLETKPRDERGPLRKLFHKKHDDDRQYESDRPPSQQNYNQHSNLPLRNQNETSPGYQQDRFGGHQNVDNSRGSTHTGGLGKTGATTAVGAGALAHENRDRDRDRDRIHDYNRGNNQRQQQQPLSQKTATLVSAGPTGAPQHFGPGYPGHKVVHACESCGYDNDITHYFGRDVVYRIHR